MCIKMIFVLIFSTRIVIYYLNTVVYFIVVTCIHEWRMYPCTGEVLPPHILTLLGGGRMRYQRRILPPQKPYLKASFKKPYLTIILRNLS